MNDKTSLIDLKGVGEKTNKLFQKLNIYTVGDLLRYYPRDYEAFREPVSIKEAKIGEICSVKAYVVGNPTLKKIRNLSILNVIVKDTSGIMQLTFFNMSFMKNLLKSGSTYIFRGLIQTQNQGYGRINGYKDDKQTKVIEQPRLYSQEEYNRMTKFIQPRYALTKGLTNLTVQKSVQQALSFFEFDAEYYPSEFMQKYNLLTCQEAINSIHFPRNSDELVKARRRLVFDEFFQFLLFLQKNKEISNVVENSFPMQDDPMIHKFLDSLPFALTTAQNQVWSELKTDLMGPYCMNRLIQGDVGSGKTIVAILALLLCACNGYQGAMMAPTEVLAMQHYETICNYSKAYQLPFRPVLLVGSQTAREKKLAYDKIASKEANLIIGTHALIQEKVIYHSLALVVTDEQHRFGVRQREMLAEKGKIPHVLVMSATPIPRTLAIILYGDLKISVINELPSDRLPIKNCVVNTSYRPKAYQFILKQIQEGRQAYVICPMVEEGELDEVENVMDYTEKLRAVFSESVQIQPLHGKMKSPEKNRIMEEFAQGKIHILVSTTVIEVGINVPNATVMMIENAERFGLAQLHQLRGRVGRGKWQSYCIFISSNENKDTMKRLEILSKSNDGFFIASEDLKLRGPGDLFGIRQSGEFSFRIGDIYTDAELLKEASQAVSQILEQDPQLKLTQHQSLKQYLQKMSSEMIDFRSI